MIKQFQGAVHLFDIFYIGKGKISCIGMGYKQRIRDTEIITIETKIHLLVTVVNNTNDATRFV